MREHPIEGLMLTAMSSIQDMIDVNTIIGDPIQVNDGTVIIPISKVTFGFAAGGSEFNGETIDEYSKKDKEEEIQYRLPFGGGSGAGVKVSPVAFLSIQDNNVKLLPVEYSSAIDKLLDYVPDLVEKANNLINKKIDEKPKNTEKQIKIKKKNNAKKPIIKEDYKFEYEEEPEVQEIDEESEDY